MALETNNNEAFLSGGGGEDDFAALDSMGLASQSQYGMNTVHMSSSIDNIGSSNNVAGSTPTTQTTGATSGAGISDGSGPGFSGVSGSLFDRIKARTAEQQKASVSTQQPPAPVAMQQQQQEAAQSSSQQSAFMSQQQQQQQQQQPPSGESSMELERHRSDEFNSSAHNNLASGMPSQQNTAIPNNNETTYSFSSGGGEDFSSQAQQSNMRVPDYGVNRYTGAAGNQQQYPNSVQDQALNTMKSLWTTGVNSAQNTIAIAQQKMGIETNGPDATPRSYNNNFLLREDSMEAGGVGATMQAPPQPISAAQFDPEHVQAGSSSNASGMGGITSEQGYSMLQYGKTFVEDVYAFVMQLPPVGKAGVGIILLCILYFLFG